MPSKRRFTLGAEMGEGGAHFSVWAPACHHVELLLEGKSYPLEKESEGIFSTFVKQAAPGMLYSYRLNQETTLPDPASRCQPQGIEGPSRVEDNSHFKWNEGSWKGLSSLKGQILYEMHVGTFSPEGTWEGARKKLPYLQELGITVIEMMPIHEFYGRFGWGYDGIYLFAPYHGYGSPDELREFIQEAHRHGIAVILDVVYNHFGPDMECHRKYSPSYFNTHMQTDWGDPLNYEGSDAKYVRELIASNAAYWIEAFHFDGLRLDATQNIYDNSPTHIIQEIVQRVKSVSKRPVIVIAENESQETKLLLEYKLDSLWNDDFHHAATVALTGSKEAYYHDYQGSPQEILSSLKYGYLYQGQYYEWQDHGRGTSSLDIAPEKFIIYLQNHDQIANSTRALRIDRLSHPDFLRALTTVFLLAPQTPLLFQGQEWSASTPFYFFADHSPFFHESVAKGRREFIAQFASAHSLEPQDYPIPTDEKTFQACRLNWEEVSQAEHTHSLTFHKALLALRKQDKTFASPRKIDGAVLEGQLLLLRFFGEQGDDRLVLCNFGKDLLIGSLAEPLYAPPFEKKWSLLFSSQRVSFGGAGHPAFNCNLWELPAYTTYVLSV